jgi:hypothetical protein
LPKAPETCWNLMPACRVTSVKLTVGTLGLAARSVGVVTGGATTVLGVERLQPARMTSEPTNKIKRMMRSQTTFSRWPLGRADRISANNIGNTAPVTRIAAARMTSARPKGQRLNGQRPAATASARDGGAPKS